MSETKPLADVKERKRVELPGLTWVRTEARAVEVDTCDGTIPAYFIHVIYFAQQPAGHHTILKIIWAIQWPFSLLRWLTIPPFCPSVSVPVCTPYTLLELLSLH